MAMSASVATRHSTCLKEQQGVINHALETGMNCVEEHGES